MIIVGILLPTFVFGGCKTSEHKTKEALKFEQDLREFYSTVQSIAEQSQTRSVDGELEPLTEAKWEEIFAEIVRISKENGIPEIVAQSGYYQNAEIPNLTEMDIYDALQWIESNGTTEYYNLILSLSDECVDIESVVGNQHLLPNEKGALIFISAIGSSPQIVLSNDPCQSAYDNAMRLCDLKYKIDAAVVSAASMVNPALGAIAFVGAETQYAICAGIAQAGYDLCISLR